MPHTVPDDLAVRKIRESTDRTFVLRCMAASRERLAELDRQEAEKERPKGEYVPLGNDVAANPGRNYGS